MARSAKPRDANPLWQLGQAAAWIVSRDEAQVSIVAHQTDQVALRELHAALMDGRLMATGTIDGVIRPLSQAEWLNCRIEVELVFFVDHSQVMLVKAMLLASAVPGGISPAREIERVAIPKADLMACWPAPGSPVRGHAQYSSGQVKEIQRFIEAEIDKSRDEAKPKQQVVDILHKNGFPLLTRRSRAFVEAWNRATAAKRPIAPNWGKPGRPKKSPR